MAHIIQKTTILPGNHRTQIHLYIESDGASGELTDYVLLDPVADLGLKSSTRMSIEMIDYNFHGFTGSVEFDSGLVEDKLIWVLPESGNSPVDFNPWGGLKDQSGLDGTGKVQFSTVGLSDAGDRGSMLIMVRHA